MYKLTDIPVDIATELKELVRYTNLRWDDIPAIETIFAQTAHAAMRDARCWFDIYPLSDALRKRVTARSALLQVKLSTPGKYASYYESSSVWLDALSSALTPLSEAAKMIDGSWDFSRRTDAAYASVRKQYPALAKALPKGWEELTNGYSDFDGMEEYDEKEKQLNEFEFQGADTASVAAPGFQERIALPFVMYDEKCQGRQAPRVLVASVYAHFLQITEHRNTQELLAAVAQLQLNDTEPDLLWSLNVKSEHPILSALIGLAAHNISAMACVNSPKEEYEEMLRKLEAYNLKSDEEKAIIAQENEMEMQRMMAAMPREDAKYERERERSKVVAKKQLRLHCPKLLEQEQMPCVA